MKISIIHPSRGRPEQATATRDKWLMNAGLGANIEYRIIVDGSDPEFLTYLALSPVVVNDGETAISAINLGAKLSTGDILIVISDDFDCPEHWDTLLLEALQGKEDFCCKTQDGHQDWLITLPIMDRTYYNRFGYVYHPDYMHMYADLEMTSVAWMLDRYIYVPLEFTHNHYRPLGLKPDAINIRNNKTWHQGQELFRKHKANNFGIEPLKQLPSLKQHLV